MLIVILWKQKLRIDLKRSKVIFCYPKWPKSYFQNGRRRPFKKKLLHIALLWKKVCVLIWNGEKWDRKWFSVIQNVAICKWTTCSHFVIFFLKSDKKWFSFIQNGRRQPFSEPKFKKEFKLRIDLKWREMESKVIFGHPKWGGGASQWPACKPFGDIHSICPWANTPILVYLWFHLNDECMCEMQPLPAHNRDVYPPPPPWST